MKYKNEPTFNDLLIQLSNIPLIGNPRENANLVSRQEIEDIFDKVKEIIRDRNKSEIIKISYCFKQVIITVSKECFVWEINVSSRLT